MNLPRDCRDMSWPLPEARCDDDKVIELRGQQLWINQQPVEGAQFEDRLRSALENRSAHCRSVFPVARPDMRYGDVVRMIDRAQSAGALHVVMLTDPRYQRD